MGFFPASSRTSTTPLPEEEDTGTLSYLDGVSAAWARQQLDSTSFAKAHQLEEGTRRAVQT